MLYILEWREWLEILDSYWVFWKKITKLSFN
jgi:hypothetical protein